MRTLNWRALLNEHGVQFIERGPNVKRGELNIQCPFCGSADPSKHMGLNLESGFWACWRNREHRGKSPLRLLVKLLGISYWNARKLAGLSDADYTDPDGFDAVAARIMGREKLDKVEHVRREFLALPEEFEPLDARASQRFLHYMSEQRAFDDEAGTLHEKYGIGYARTGTYRDRIILPYYMDGELVAWTARAIAQATIRYRDLDRDTCLVPIKETLYNFDGAAAGGVVLVVQEGPIDALKVDLYGAAVGVRAVALSTNSISAEQIYMLEEFAPQFKQVLVMLDTATELGVVDSMRMKQDLRPIRNLSIVPTPYGLKDAALMTPLQACTWTTTISKEYA